MVGKNPIGSTTLRLVERLAHYFDDRVSGTQIDTVIIHSMFATGYPDPYSCLSCVEMLDLHQVSAHYLIGRNGEVWRLVPEEKRAWHAGVSRMPDGREGVNHFSIGIELIGDYKQGFTEKQYNFLGELLVDLCHRFPIVSVLGHSDVALPRGRKVDPGPLFNWDRVIKGLRSKFKERNFSFPGRANEQG